MIGVNGGFLGAVVVVFSAFMALFSYLFRPPYGQRRASWLHRFGTRFGLPCDCARYAPIAKDGYLFCDGCLVEVGRYDERFTHGRR